MWTVLGRLGTGGGSGTGLIHHVAYDQKNKQNAEGKQTRLRRMETGKKR